MPTIFFVTNQKSYFILKMLSIPIYLVPFEANLWFNSPDIRILSALLKFGLKKRLNRLKKQQSFLLSSLRCSCHPESCEYINEY